MRIIQVLPVLAYGDAVGNDTVALHNILLKNGYDAEIYAEIVDKRIPKKTAWTMDDWKEPEKDDVIIYHLAVGWHLIDLIKSADCRKIAIYHNVTPRKFAAPYDRTLYAACSLGLSEVKKLKDTFDYCLADSEFNRQDLISYGYSCKIDVLPILIAFEDYKKTPDEEVISKYRNMPGSNILFVGRVAPNKKHEDVIAAFSLYKKYYDPDARLFLVGSFADGDAYHGRLADYIEELGVKDVIFPGHISFNAILAYYAVADVFVCMSEHEGFCVPLVESMYFNVPVIAYDACAVGETLGDSGILVRDKNYLEIAGLIDRVVKDEDLRAEIIRRQKEHLKDFDNEVIGKMFLDYLTKFLEETK